MSVGHIGMCLLLAALASINPSGLSAATDCSYDESLKGGCTTSTLDPDGVTLEGTKGDGKTGAGPGEDGSGTGTDTADGGGFPEGCQVVTKDICVTGPAKLTISDIAHFRADAGAQFMQPNGWAVIGLHSNFYATSTTQIVAGQLLGQSAEVRFTPITWHWSYGDGATTSSATGGGPWPGKSEFEATATSHIYRTAGTYLVDASVDFRAEYRLGGGAGAGGGWVPITGTLTLPLNQLTITAGTAKTVLVNSTCNTNPKGPGC